MQETNKRTGDGFNWVQPPDAFQPTFPRTSRATKTYPPGTPITPPIATPKPPRGTPRGRPRTNAKGQVLTWGPFTFLGPITTTKGLNPSNQLELNDNQGDPFMDIIDGKFRCVYHGTKGLVYIDKEYDGDPLNNWSNPLIDPDTGAAGTPGTHSAEKVIPHKSGPLSLQSVNVDTPSLVAHGDLYQLHYSSKPGVRVQRYPLALGEVYCIQRATVKAGKLPSQKEDDWDIKPGVAVFEPQNAHFPQGGEPGTPIATWEREFYWVPEGELNPKWDGGVLEQSVLWDPDLNRFVMFYGAFTGNQRGPGPYRLGRAFSTDGETWWRDPPPSSQSYVWSPAQEPRGWGSMSIPHHFAVTRAPDGVYHLAMLGAHPEGGPASQGIGHWYSTEKGAKGSWIADLDNPLITWRDVWPSGSLGGFNDRLGSPKFFFDYQTGKVYLSFDGNGVNLQKRYKQGSRIYVAEAQLPLQR